MKIDYHNLNTVLQDLVIGSQNYPVSVDDDEYDHGYVDGIGAVRMILRHLYFETLGKLGFYKNPEIDHVLAYTLEELEQYEKEKLLFFNADKKCLVAKCKRIIGKLRKKILEPLPTAPVSKQKEMVL